MADNVNAGEAERLEGIEVAIGEIGNVIDPSRGLGGAEAGMIGHDHVEAFRQFIEDRRPFAEPIRAVQIDQRCTLAAARKAQLAAVDLDCLPDKCHKPPAKPVRRREKG